MRNQSVKNPKVFPASTATLGDTLRDSLCIYTGVLYVQVREKEREKADKQNSCIMDSSAARHIKTRAKPFDSKPPP